MLALFLKFVVFVLALIVAFFKAILKVFATFLQNYQSPA